jgi:predicted dehydrogenase
VKDFFAGVSPMTVSYRFASGHIPANAWPQDEEVGGGRIVGEGCHAIDTCVALVGSPPVRVFAESVGAARGLETSDDQVFITLRHENGSISNVSYQAGGDRSAPMERFEVYGGGRTALVEEFHTVNLYRNEKVKEENGERDRGHSNGFKAFMDACRTGGPWPISWKELYGTMWASLMAVRSLREGVAVDIDSTDDV